MAVHLPFDAGFVSAFYFVFLDLILLTNLDVAISHILCHLYYRRIFRTGSPLYVRSVDIPGVTNFIVGRPLSLVNITFLCIKLLFLCLVFFLDRNILADPIRNLPQSSRLLSTFDFDASESAWGDGTGPYRIVHRRFIAGRSCYVPSTETQFLKRLS